MNSNGLRTRPERDYDGDGRRTVKKEIGYTNHRARRREETEER